MSWINTRTSSLPASRFESLTLSHNNMIALKPVLSAWLDEAEAAKRDPDSLGGGVLPPGEKKRKRTSIAAPEKRSLEAYFAVQPRPSGEKASRSGHFPTSSDLVRG